MRRGSRAMAERVAAARADLTRRLPRREFELVRSFEHVNAVAGFVDAQGLDRLRTIPGVLRVDLDLGGAGQLNQAIPLSHLDSVKALGLSGEGVTVAVLDSGYDSDHVDLVDDLAGEACFCSGGGGCCPGGVASSTAPGSAEDDHGHGTNVSGIITGAGNLAPAGGAPAAKIVAVKVLDAGNAFCCVSDVVAGLDWLIGNRPDVDIVNMSLGTFTLFNASCDASVPTLASAIDTLRANGVTVFASSGNDASATQMSAPACVDHTIAVGAVWDNSLGPQMVNGCSEVSTAPDQVTCFSNSNTRTDLFAPGAKTSAPGLGGGMSTYTGTSQASPLAAACAALLLESDPTLVPDEIEARLEASPTRVTDAKNGLDFPRLDCQSALDIGPPVPVLAPITIAALALSLIVARWLRVRRGSVT
jgi:subtilisin family serine protease